MIWLLSKPSRRLGCPFDPGCLPTLLMKPEAIPENLLTPWRSLHRSSWKQKLEVRPLKERF